MKISLLIRFILLFLILSSEVMAQVEVRGVVRDNETGDPLIGATVMIKGTSNGTITDIDGSFSLSVGSENAILVFSYTGYQALEIKAEKNMQIILKIDDDLLDEFVVVGYGSVKRSDLTNAVSSVSAENFNKQPLSNLSQALRGRAAGVQVTQTSGDPAGGFKIRIRGSNSITGSNEPLYVVDGQFVDISTVNVNDVQSMEVLKDASSTAIYGTRGANGVILITTKRGRSGKAVIDADFFTGISNVTQRLDLMSAAEFAEGVVFAEGVDPNQPNPFYTTQEIEALRRNGGEDWQSRLFQTGVINNMQMSASGGSDKLDYYISGNYYQSRGTIVDQLYRRLNLRSNLNAKLSDKIKVGLNLNIGNVRTTGVRADLGVGLSFDPTTPAFDENGDYNFNSIKNVATSERNPLIAVENNQVRNNLDRMSVMTFLNYDITKNLVFNFSTGIDKSDAHNNSYAPLISSNNGLANVNNNYGTRFFNTNRFTYTTKVNEIHSFKIDGVYEIVKENSNSVNIRASNFFTDLVGYRDLSIAAIQIVQNGESNRTLESVLGRVNYALLDKYVFEASVRADGSSVFQKDKWGYFPSGSMAWKVSEENFMKNVSFIDNLKMRASYGEVGNQGINVFGTRSRAVINVNRNYPFDGTLTTGVAPSNRVANPDLTWEKTRQMNVGFDLGIFKSGVNLSVDFYKKNTTDLLLDTQLPQFVGPTLKYVNAGEVENRGFDISLDMYLLERKDWVISSILTVSRNQNKVLSLNDDVQFLILGDMIRENTFPVNPTRVEVGLPISSFRGYIFEGVYQLGEEDEAARFNKVPGQAKYRDINGDGVITTDDITTVGNGNPQFTWGWNWDVNYKSWNLNFLFVGSYGNDIYNLQRARLMSLGAQQFHAVYGDYRDRWTPTNPSNIPSGRNGTEILSSQFIEDGSFASLKNVSLSYNLNSKALQKLKMNKLRVYGGVENLFFLTKYTGFDPETTASVSNSDVDAGIDYNSYPLNRTYTLGLQISF